MKRFGFFFLSSLFASVFLLGFLSDAAAQPEVFRVRRIEPRMVDPPRYQVRDGRSIDAGRAGRWLEVRLQYDRPEIEWLDEATFTYYIVLHNRRPAEGEREYNLFRGEVTYVNIPRERNLNSVMYLHPRTMERYGEVDRVAVVISSQGRMLAIASDPDTDERWWERLPPKTGFVLNRLETPFAMLNTEAFEAIKVE